MKAVERKWGHDGTWLKVGVSAVDWLTEPKMWEAFWDEIRHPTNSDDGWDCLPLFVRYSNGQACVFKRKTQ